MHDDRLVVKELYECGYSLHFGTGMAHVHIAIVKWLHAGDLQYIIEDRCGPSNWSSAIYHCTNTYQGQQESVQELQGNQLAKHPR